MSAFSEGESYDENPFVFFMSDEYIINPQSTQEMPNPLRAMYEDLAPLLLRSPPSKRYPQQPTGMKDLGMSLQTRFPNWSIHQPFPTP